MTAHKHAEMIKAKADNMELVVLLNKYGKWQACHETSLPIYSDCEYFLCLPQHNEACLHWLNGGDVEEKGIGADDKYFEDPFEGEPCPFKWYKYHSFMDKDSVFRIKPKKEKRIVAVRKTDGFVECCHFKDEHEANKNGCNNIHWSYHKIEVEV